MVVKASDYIDVDYGLELRLSHRICFPFGISFLISETLNSGALENQTNILASDMGHDREKLKK